MEHHLISSQDMKMLQISLNDGAVTRLKKVTLNHWDWWNRSTQNLLEACRIDRFRCIEIYSVRFDEAEEAFNTARDRLSRGLGDIADIMSNWP